MAANNMIMVIGRVGRDPEVRTISSGRSVAKFSVAVNRPVKDKQGNSITDWFNVDLWGRQAELAGELVRKGTLLSVVGACQIDEYTDRDGNRQKMVKIAAESFQLLESKGAEGGRGYDDGYGDAGSSREPAGARSGGFRMTSTATRDGAAMASGKDDDYFDDDIPPF